MTSFCRLSLGTADEFVLYDDVYDWWSKPPVQALMSSFLILWMHSVIQHHLGLFATHIL